MPPPPSAFADALVLTGPTGAGKTAVALDLADRLGCEVVALDSMTVYRGLDVGTAKPTPAERDRVRHHLIDVLDPWESAHVAWWLDAAAAACAEVRERGKRPLFVGGTPFYLKALLHGLSDAPNDVRRVVRALEVFELAGRPISAFQQTWDTPSFAGPAAPPPANLPCVVLEWPRDELYRRIDARVSAMLAAGWLDEVRRLRELPRPVGKEASQALGYRELHAFLSGTGPGWDDTVSLIRTRTRQFAKRQLTWFRHLAGCVPVAADGPAVADRVVAAWAKSGTPSAKT